MFLQSRFPSPYRSSFLLSFALLSALAAQGQKEIYFISDTQAPMWVETLWLKPYHNVAATERLFSDIINHKPSTLFMLGDVVTLSCRPKTWSRMDSYLDNCRKAGIHVSALLGNHDVMSSSKRGEAQFQKRFPNHIRTGFRIITDSIAVVFLNSNFKKLAPEDLIKEQTWLQKTLDSLDQNPAVLTTLMACHHAPFSNSKIVHSSLPVQQKFVPAFLHSKKARIFITGHSHNFERFKHEGKDFVVIGGGGGLKQPIAKEKKRIKDKDLSDLYKPLFHYLILKREGDTLRLTSRELMKGNSKEQPFAGFRDSLHFSVPIH